MRTALLTPLEAADILRVSVDTIRRCIHNGTFKAVKIGQQYRIKQTDIDKILGEPTQQQQRLVDQVEREIVQSALDGMRHR
jgi:excisionase family DNA binding protein